MGKTVNSKSITNTINLPVRVGAKIINKLERIGQLFAIARLSDYRPPKELNNITSEHIVAEWDQDNRICFFQNLDLPGLEGERVDKSAFIPRQRNRLQLVYYCGQLAIRKQYQSFGCFTNEAIALHKLNSVHGVPDLLGINLVSRVLYQSHIIGNNLGSMLAINGVSIAMQHVLNGVSEQHRENHDRQIIKKQLFAKAQLLGCVDVKFINSIQKLITAIHDAGVILRDVKYGNVLVNENSPSICDFDSAIFISKPNEKFLQEKAADLRRFDFLFG
jgi:hypothetical protein